MIVSYKTYMKESDDYDLNSTIINGIYDPMYDDYGLVIFNSPKSTNDYRHCNIKEYNLCNGLKFKKEYVEFEDKKIHKVVYKSGINLGSNLGIGTYYCATKECLDVYLGKTRDSSEYANFVKGIVSMDLPNDYIILVKLGIADLL